MFLKCRSLQATLLRLIYNFLFHFLLVLSSHFLKIDFPIICAFFLLLNLPFECEAFEDELEFNRTAGFMDTEVIRKRRNRLYMKHLISVLVFLDHGNGRVELTVVGGVCLLGIFQ